MKNKEKIQGYLSLIDENSELPETFKRILNDPVVVQALSNAYERHTDGVDDSNMTRLVNAKNYNSILFLARYMYLSLGFYGTEYNYPEGIYLGSLGCLDRGDRAKDAMQRVKDEALFNGISPQEWPCAPIKSFAHFCSCPECGGFGDLCELGPKFKKCSECGHTFQFIF